MATLAALYNDNALVDDVSAHINHFIDTRFDGLTPELRVVLTEVCAEMFQYGAEWADQTAGRDAGPQVITHA